MDWQKLNENFNNLIKLLFHGENWEERAEAARQLGFLRDARAVNLLCRALKSEKDSIVSLRIIEAMGRIGDGRSTILIIDKLNDVKDEIEENKITIIACIEALSRIKDKRALPYIADYLDSPHNDIKNLTEKAFDEILPNWREIIKREQRERSLQEIFRVDLK
jgi:HEAT repeat protein